MASVDDRIVAMQFDNKVFEDKVATTIASLDKLKTSLDFSNSKKGMADLQTASKGFNLDGIASAIEGVSSKFSAMGVVAFTVIQRITTAAIDAGVSIVKSLSLDQVIAGFREYETNMNAIQTVLANTKADGTTLNDVNKALETLNAYSDQTIYNFGEMARNIGTFTAAGVDLDTSVQSIKGIANLAAISGSNSQQASTAMYQLSQALATGTVKLMDWNSIVNAGMGGEVFQKALFETGKTLGTIADTDIDTTFEEWTAAGNTFRGSLEDGWLTAEVLTNTLQGFTGDLTDAQLASMGYNEEQIKQIQEMGETGKDAATKVKTLTQLVSTVKESIGSGWSQTFKILVGDFEEAKELFTGISEAIGGIVGASADSRNGMLQMWKDMGGRDTLIEGLTNVFKSLGIIMHNIKVAFEEIFPPMTAGKLILLTDKFKEFTEKLTLSGDTLGKIQDIFKGIFALFSIGIEIVKGIAGVFVDLFTSLSGQVGDDGLLSFLADLGTKIVELKEALVDGGGIAQFFEDISTNIAAFFDNLSLSNIVEKLTEFIIGLKDAFLGLFDSMDLAFLDGIKEFFSNIFGNFDPEVTNSMSGGFEQLGGILGFFGKVLQKVGAAVSWFWDQLVKVKDKIVSFATAITDSLPPAPDLSAMIDTIVNAVKNADWALILEAFKTAISAIWATGFSNIAKNGLGINLDLTGGALTGLGDLFAGIKTLLPGISQSITAVTGTLEAMQTKLKAEALQKIAIAIGILAVAMVVLSMIDPIALGKALAAMAVGFVQLSTAMAVLMKMTSGPTGAASLGVVATSMILLAGAILVLSIAVKILSTMDLDKLAQGLVGVGVMMGIMVVAAKQLAGYTHGMITAGIGMMAMAVALIILAAAVKLFSMMSWEEMAKGLIGVGVGLGILVVAMKNLPGAKSMLASGAGLIMVAIALNILALAVKSFAEMSWADMGKGLAGIGGGLAVLATGLHFMPKPTSMLASGAGLLAISVALNLMATAIMIMSSMSWSEIAKGLIAMGLALAIIIVAAKTMEKAIMGANGISLMSIALISLAYALKQFGEMSWDEMLKGFAGLAGSLTILGVAAYFIGPFSGAMIALGIGLLAMGAGFALFGLGASLAAGAFIVLVEAGTAGVDLLLYAFDALLERLPELGKALAGLLISLADQILKAAPSLIASFGKVIAAFLQTIIDNAPKFAETLIALVTAGLTALQEIFPLIVETGLGMLIALLTGVRDNIGEITILVVDIITNFLDALAEKVPQIIDSVYNLLIAILSGVAEKLGEVASYLWPKGVEFLSGLWDGIVEKAKDVATWFTELPGNILGWIGDVATWLKDKGIDLIKGLIEGYISANEAVVEWFMQLPGKIFEWIGDVATFLKDKGIDLIQGLWNGAVELFESYKQWVMSIPGMVVTAVGVVLTTLVQKGKDLITGLWNGAKEVFTTVGTWVLGLPIMIRDKLGDVLETLLQAGKDLVTGLWNGLVEKFGLFLEWIKVIPTALWAWGLDALNWLYDAGVNLVIGLWNGIKDKADWLWDKITGWAQGIWDGVTGFFGINSPSRLFMELGGSLVEGLVLGIENTKKDVENSSEALGYAVSDSFNPDSGLMSDKTTEAINAAFMAITAQLGDLDNLNPTITPVLDLTLVEKDAKRLGALIGSGQNLSADVSYSQASALVLDTTQDTSTDGIESTSATKEIQFVQNNYSPEALSTAAIYRQTRNQIALAKEELAVL